MSAKAWYLNGEGYRDDPLPIDFEFWHCPSGISIIAPTPQKEKKEKGNEIRTDSHYVGLTGPNSVFLF